MNSGNPKSAVESYAQETKFEWPILVDEARETEKQAGLEISLQNIYQWLVVDPEGKIHKAGSSQQGAEALIEKFLPSAKLLFDGVQIPDRLKPLARDIELGIYEPGVAEIASLASRSGSGLPEAAKAMYEKLKPTAESGLERGKAAKEGGQLWTAYKEFEAVALAFKRTPYEKTATAALSELRKDKPIKDELAARQLLAQAKAFRATGKKNDAAQAQAILQALQKRYPDTESAKVAAALR